LIILPRRRPQLTGRAPHRLTRAPAVASATRSWPTHPRPPLRPLATLRFADQSRRRGVCARSPSTCDGPHGHSEAILAHRVLEKKPLSHTNEPDRGYAQALALVGNHLPDDLSRASL